MMEELRGLARAHYAELARIGKAMGSPARLMLIDLLRQGPRSVEQLAEESSLTVANTSQHLQQLAQANLVRSTRWGHMSIYRLNGGSVAEIFTALRELAEELLPEMDRLKESFDVLDDESRDQLLASIKRKQVTLVDVRPREEFEAGHLPGAISIPMSELKSRAAELPRSREVIAYCRGPYCPMALEAVKLLKASGYRARHLDLGAADVTVRGRRKR